MLDMTGDIGGMIFTDPFGFSVVGNDRLLPNETDFLSVTTAIIFGTTFEINGYTLSNVRMLWIAGVTTPDDFLQSDLLPAALPVGLTGRVVLDFFLSSDPNITTTVSFEDLSITLSP